MPDGCVFCQVVSGVTPAAVVYSDDHFLAFLDHRPVFKGHVLVVPREHVETLPDVPASLLGPLFSLVQRFSVAVPAACEAEGTFVAMNNKISQSVPHLHVHIVPRRKGDGLRGFFWPRTKYGPGEAERYREAIAALM